MQTTDSLRFPVFLIKPSHYDDDGYVIRWRRSVIPSNTLATLYGLVADCAERRVLGQGVEIECHALDETNTRIDVARIVREIRSAGSGLVGFVGVQSNQFPRAMDLARQFREAGVSVAIGGFHVSGCLAMLPGVQPDLQEAIDLGVSIYAGEAEGRLEALLQDVAHGAMKPIYNFLSDLPGLQQQPVPFLPKEVLSRGLGVQASFDAGRGCPFQCSFCTIINVQGRKSRRRNADDVERIVRMNRAQNVRNFFISDDNFARNRDWESILDRLIELREHEQIEIKITMQVDTLCHKIPGFIEKARRAGVRKVFIGLENINPEALKGAGKRQNQISEYRNMMQAWQNQGVIVFAGYIIGFPGDTRESVRRDIEIIQRELPVDILEFFVLTPLPGSQDHKELFHAGVPMDPDMNSYDTYHVTTGHSQMSQEQWRDTYRMAWSQYYSPEHIETLLRRARASGIKTRKMANMALWFHGCASIEDLHPLDGGFFRMKTRSERRPGLPVDSALRFHVRYAWEIASKHARYLRLIARLRWFEWRLDRDPEAANYRDDANRALIPRS
ncbi:MAG: radical SAM protein [Deltaproteobacteria bacterium]|nr:radical SAM protein [Deltaproteobacteria bacterium]MBW2362229.1 radical SAM protein [Deltaproteobacteria bacterium]